MPTIKQTLLGIVLVAATLLHGVALADRPPSPQERSRIETMLRNEGFTRWGKIEYDYEGMSGKSTTPMPPTVIGTI
jgi:hypothetical protein